MRSLRSRLLVLWAMTCVASVVVGALLVDSAGRTTAARVGQAAAEVARACDSIRDRFDFYAAGWSGPATLGDAKTRRDLADVVTVALAHAPGVEGGFWQTDAGPLAYAYPTYPGAAKTDLPAAERARIAAASEQAAGDEQGVSATETSDRQTLLLHACPIAGPIAQLSGWAMTRVDASGSVDALQTGLATLMALMAGITVWLAWLLVSWSRRVGRVEAALAGHARDTPPRLDRTGEPDLDRIVAALNESGARQGRLAAEVAGSARLAALGRVAAGVAHELRNPVGAMRLRVENALAVPDPARREAALRAVLEQLGRLDRLSGGLLAMTRPRVPRPEPTDLFALLRDCAALFCLRAEARQVALVVEATGSAAIDPDLARTALDPLVDNAVRHARTRVRLSGAVHGGRVRVTVADDGAGVDAALHDTLFDPFVTGRPEGTGLGLAIAREAAAQQGGRLTLDPDRTETRFVLELPSSPPF